MTGRVAGKVAIVTGGASGIGRATAERFASEGAIVVVADVDEAGGRATVSTAQAEGGDAHFIRTDMTDPSQVQRLVDETVSLFGRLDVLHNNAFWAALNSPVVDTSDADWIRTIDTSLRGVFHGCRAAIPAMIASGGGAIVNMSSVAGTNTSPRTAAYAAAKGGVISLTRAIALDYGRQGIRANAVAPGTIDTPAVAHILADPVRRDYLTGRILVGRIGHPRDIAAAVLYLASDEASFVTGQVLVVDGGRTIS